MTKDNLEYDVNPTFRGFTRFPCFVQKKNRDWRDAAEEHFLYVVP